MRRMRNLTLLLLSTCLLCACGQKGNLKLPDDNRDEVRPPAAPAAAPGTATDGATPEERERERANAARRNSGN